MWTILGMAIVFAAIIFALGLASAKRTRQSASVSRRTAQSENRHGASPQAFDMAARGINPETLGDPAREKMAAIGK